MTEPTNGDQPAEQTAEPIFFFHMVLAEVIFSLDNGKTVHSRRIQFFSKYRDNTFTAEFLSQIQNTAAMGVLNTIAKDKQAQYKVLDTLLHALHPCGYMTDATFYGRHNVAQFEVAEQEAAEAPETPADDKVVSIRKPTKKTAKKAAKKKR